MGAACFFLDLFVERWTGELGMVHTIFHIAGMAVHTKFTLCQLASSQDHTACFTCFFPIKIAWWLLAPECMLYVGCWLLAVVGCWFVGVCVIARCRLVDL